MHIVFARARSKKLTTNLIGLAILSLLLIWLFFFRSLLAPGYELANHYLQLGESLQDKGKILFSSILLVLLYTFTELPIFLAAVMLENMTRQRWGKFLSVFIYLSVIVASYLILVYVHEYNLFLLTPILVTLLYIVLTKKMKIDETKYFYQAILLFQLLLGIQWFEINPLLQRWGFGKTETVRQITSTLEVMNGEHILQFVSLIISAPYTMSTIITIILLRIQVLRVQEIEASKRRELEYQQLRLEAVESRASQEMHTLVHDLKTPLTTIQGLISLINMHRTSNSNAKLYGYAEKIDSSVTLLNEMISEILYEEVKRPIELRELVNYTKAHLDLTQEVQFIIEDEDKVITINRVRVVRAIINLVQNALEATQNREEPQVIVKIFYIRPKTLTAKEGAVISVIDNGDGIQYGHMQSVWQERFSTRGKSGLGLTFVKNVAESHDGWVNVNSVLDKGSTIALFLPRGEIEHDEQKENTNH